ncbi:MAG: aldo/keto reductase [Candidatus Handelsmanbacteria bacterium]|nr:aldo/keto reductase [Candidatus Handelsmanbacteria bacterium]
MEYQVLRGTGIKVSRLCLGAMTFGDQAQEEEARGMIDVALEAGVNFIDTADAYVGGRSEEIVGRALLGRRHRVVLASKVRSAVGPDPHKDQGLHRWHLIRGVEASLKRLQTDCLDICYLHAPDYQTPIEETLAACDTLVQQGKVVYVGMSNYAAWQMCEALWRCDRRHWTPPAVMQVVYNLVARSLEAEGLGFSQKMGMGMVVYNPLAGGLLTGKHRQAEGPEAGTRFGLKQNYYRRYWSPAHFAAVDRLAQVAAKPGIPLTQLALQWLLSQPLVDAVILGASRQAQLEENLRLAQGRLDAPTLAACDEVWRELRGDHFEYNR